MGEKQSLSNRQRVFVEEYLTCWNASEAARRAGYTGQANVVGPRLLADVRIQSAIEARIAEKAMTADEVLLRLADQARASMEDFITGGDIDLSKAQQYGKLHLVKRVSVTDKGGVTIELYDAQAALVQLGRHHGLFVDKQEISGSLGISIDDYNAAKQRAEQEAHSE